MSPPDGMCSTHRLAPSYLVWELSGVGDGVWHVICTAKGAKERPTKLLGGEGKDRGGAGSGTHLNKANLETRGAVLRPCRGHSHVALWLHRMVSSHCHVWGVIIGGVVVLHAQSSFAGGRVIVIVHGGSLLSVVGGRCCPWVLVVHG